MNYIGYQTQEQFREMLRHPLKYGLDRCLACGATSVAGAGMFFPNEDVAKRIGQPRNKRRVAVYVLCQPCLDDYDHAIRRVEEKLLRDAGVQ
jgi:hypothetical protein